MQRSKIRLLKFVGLFAVGGTERHVLNLARELDGSQFELHVACFKRWGLFLKEMEALSVPISEYRINCLYNVHTFRQQLRFARSLKQARVQIVHTYGFYSTVFAVPAARLARIPVVVTSIRDTGELLTPIQKRAQRLACKLADSVFVNADAVRHWLIAEGYNANRIQVIRNGISPVQFAGKEDGATIRQEFGIPSDAPLIAMLSRLNRLKGGEYFLEAAAMVAERFPNARFLVVGDTQAGDSAYKEQLEKQANRLGLRNRLHFTGFRLDIPRILAALTVSVLPSLSEGLSNVLLESMAAGVPVVATTVGGNSEVVEDGVTGILVPPGDSGALAQAVSEFLEKPELACHHGLAGKQRISERFDLDDMVHQTEQHYLRLLTEATPEAREVGEVPV